ncbi:lysophospholipid acyltransferase family protein [Phaeobacter marinintestinus]|uniref:lysophospholipid acyltransferase family protein n=1 Tax=Falsiphaeobacter marinintestinus TaxID=1492905 RepID=UPI0011B5B801|nr:lysophospholipid acyltransferase family protein [Phaeobacter marinintestinus]
MPVDPSTLSTFDRVGYFLSNAILRGVIGGACLLPYRWRVPMIGRLISTLSPLIGWSKRISDNLRLARPDLSEAEIKALCRSVPDNAGRTVIEIYSGQDFIDRGVQAPIRGDGLKALEEARDAGRPVILITAHFGNYDAARAKLFSLGFELGGLYRRMANPYFNDHYVSKIKQLGEPLFEQGRRGMTQMVRYLRRGGIIAIVADLHVHGGEELTFFGQPAVTSVLNAELALKYNAVIIPIYAIRQPNGLDFEVVMNAPIPHSDPITMTQALNDDLEALVRDHMDQWFWIHRRWKPWFHKGLQPKAEVTQD